MGINISKQYTQYTQYKQQYKHNENLINIINSFLTCVILVNADAIVEYINTNGEELFGYNLNEVKNKHINIFVPDDVKRCHLNMIHAFEYSNIRTHMIGKKQEVQAQKKCGTLFDIELILNTLVLNGKTKHLIFCCIADKRCVKIQKELNDVCEITNTGKWEWDVKTGEIFLSKQLQKIYGVKNSSILTYNESLTLIHPEDIEFIKRKTEDFFVNKRNETEFVYRMNTKNSNIQKFLYCKTKSLIENGEIVRIYGLTQDITDKINTERKLETSMSIIQNISHELKSPLGNIMQVCSFLEETKLNTEQHKQVCVINETITFLITIINNILEISKMNSNKISLDIESFNIRNLINIIMLNYKVSIDNKNLKCEYNISSDIPEIIVADKLKIRQILNNFLSNSIKYTNKGYIKLNIESIAINKIKFTVEDSGIGINLKNQKEIFKPFTQFTKNSIGTGLGLSICKKLVDVMKGEIGFSSELNKGSVFWFSINNTNLN